MTSHKQPKGPKTKNFRISIVDDMTHKQLWVMRLSRTSLFLTVISVISVIIAVCYSVIAFTPIRTFIPGYPDAHTKRAAINNALKIDSPPERHLHMDVLHGQPQESDGRC